MLKIVFGSVTDNNDPIRIGRVKASIPSLTMRLVKNAAGKDTPIFPEYPYWIEPSFPFAGNNFGYFFVPPIDSKIEIEINSDLQGNFRNLTWRSCLYSANEPIPEEFRTDYPQRMGIKTKNGVLMILDDKIQEFIIEATKIRLGDGAAEPLVLGTQLQTYINATLKTMLDAHVHLGNLGGPTSAPLTVTPTLPGAALSDKAYTEK